MSVPAEGGSERDLSVLAGAIPDEEEGTSEAWRTGEGGRERLRRSRSTGPGDPVRLGLGLPRSSPMASVALLPPPPVDLRDFLSASFAVPEAEDGVDGDGLDMSPPTAAAARAWKSNLG